MQTPPPLPTPTPPLPMPPHPWRYYLLLTSAVVVVVALLAVALHQGHQPPPDHSASQSSDPESLPAEVESLIGQEIRSDHRIVEWHDYGANSIEVVVEIWLATGWGRTILPFTLTKGHWRSSLAGPVEATTTESLDSSSLENVANWCSTQSIKIGDLEQKNQLRGADLKRAREDELRAKLVGKTVEWNLTVANVGLHTVSLAADIQLARRHFWIISAKDLERQMRSNPKQSLDANAHFSHNGCRLVIGQSSGGDDLAGGIISGDLAKQLDAGAKTRITAKVANVGLGGTSSDECGWVALDNITVLSH